MLLSQHEVMLGHGRGMSCVKAFNPIQSRVHQGADHLVPMIQTGMRDHRQTAGFMNELDRVRRVIFALGTQAGLPFLRYF